MAHGDAQEGKWRGNWRMQWVASSLALYLRTRCIQHYYRWCAHLGCQQSTELTPPGGRFKWTRPLRGKKKSWFLRMCHHIWNAVYTLRRPHNDEIAYRRIFFQNVSPSLSDAYVCCHLRLARLYLIFAHYLIHGTIFGKKVTERKICVLIFSTTFVWNISHSKKKWAGCDKTYISVCM
jgi:hypothetical protein